MISTKKTVRPGFLRLELFWFDLVKLGFIIKFIKDNCSRSNR
jgi:hypothetical protein